MIKMISPHGGKLVKRFKEKEEFKLKIEIDFDTYQDVENIATGVFSPLEGFLNKEEYESVVNRGRLPDGTPWTIPILLHVSDEKRKNFGIGEKANLTYNGEDIGEIEIEEIFSIDPGEYSIKVFKTEKIDHPGVNRIFSLPPFCISGKIYLYKRMEHKFSRYHLTPEEVREEFKKRGWRKVVAFQTRNVPHIGHEYVQKVALTLTDGLFINPLIGKKKKGDFKDEVIIRSYEVLIENYYPKNVTFLSILSTSMKYAGPKEAIHHAIMRKNFGATHFIIGRDHAGVGDFYGPFDAHKIFDEYPDLEIEPIFFKAFFKCKRCGGVVNDKICPHSEEDRINFSGTSIRKAILEGHRPSEEVMRPEVADVILKYKNPFV